MASACLRAPTTPSQSATAPQISRSRGPPPQRPPRPNEMPSQMPSQIPSPSIYSVRSGMDSETCSNYPFPTRPARSFSQPKAYQNHPPRPYTADDGSCPSPTSTVDMTPRISISTEDLFRHSTASTSSSVPTVPPIPLPEPPLPLGYPQPHRTAGLAAPSAQKTRARRSSVSPIPEELPNPRQTLGSLASSRAIPSSWGSGPAESEILGAYLDTESEDEEHSQDTVREDKAALVRNASVGKRGKPTMRTISKSNPNSEVMVPDVPSTQHKGDSQSDVSDGAVITVAAIGKAMRQPTPVRRASASTVSGESYIDPEKPRFAHPVPDHMDLYRDTGLEKEVEALPAAAPTMSDKRPGGRKPPRLDIGAVRNAEARGSLSSLSDLIRRATKLASNLDHGRTASRNDALNPDAEPKAPFGRRRNSGSISDILHMFPNPALDTPDKPRGSWPVFFGRSGLRNGEALGSNADEPAAQKPPRRCCGMARKWFIILCVVLFIIIILAVLLPVFLVAVPNEKSSSSDTSCASSNPCENGGVSVSSGTQCSCVCSNGYTGSTCTTSGDSSCISSNVDNGTISKNATMGSSLPTIFNQSKTKFDITLDPVTIMALFSMNNISCKTENALIAFSDVDRSSSSSSDSTQPTPTLLAARSEQTINGILVDGSGNHSGSKNTETETKTTSIAANPATATATSTSSSKAKATGVPESVIEFSQVAVLFIMQDTGSLDSALSSEKEIASYLSDSYAAASRPSLELMGTFSLDFANKTITREGTGLTVH
ncbi:hypothetical protein N7509_005206 [Penicillium cosmopolitanum]|uniref:EGF-like domain-containing protein n=1 Tax=Penicillium cosmopolitanum TaxID=1131564 RepID=A0A9W9W1Z6_9EURO|nr:uncharacterized protein N7509_005206 [Penicillium cosmopolitanum]KAJ5397093.1 hypothetical protein N7509_005206 [Penicillium cosmopolitanum]